MDSQQNYIQGRADVGGLLYENYTGKIKPHFSIMDPLLTLFKTVGDKGYQLTGKKLVLAHRFRRRSGWLGTAGELPNNQYAAPVQTETTPGRFYIRGAIDNFMEAVSNGAGSYGNLFEELNTEIWEAVEEGQIRHLHGSSAGTLCLIASRTSATKVTVKDGLGYTGQPPLEYLEDGNVMWVCVLDASNAYAPLGAAFIQTIDWTGGTNQITFASAIDNGTTTVAAGDPVVMCTTPVLTDSHFQHERGRAKLGFLDHIDPRSANSSYLTLVEADNPRYRPTRVNNAGAAITELGFMKFTRELAAKSHKPVTPDTHTMSTQPGIVMALAEDISGNAQLNLPKGKELDGGWTTVRVGGHDFIESERHLWDTIYAHPMDEYARIDLDGDPRAWAGDGNQFKRLADFDGREWFIRHYGQDIVAGQRNRIGALWNIANADKLRYVGYPTS